MAVTKMFVNQMWHVYWVAGMVLHRGLFKKKKKGFCQVHHCGVFIQKTFIHHYNIALTHHSHIFVFFVFVEMN